MKYFISILFLCIFSFSGYTQTKTASKNSLTLQTGFNRGFGIMGSFSIHRIADGLPGNLRLSAGLNWMNPGNATDARRIFINNATNGVPEKKGTSIDFRLDYMMPYKLFNLKGLGTMNSVFGWVQRYKDEMECFHVKAKDKIEIVSPINVMRFQ